MKVMKTMKSTSGRRGGGASPMKGKGKSAMKSAGRAGSPSKKGSRRVMKRSASPHSPSPVKRGRKAAASDEPWASIVAAVEGAPEEVLPTEVRTMLCNVLGRSLSAPKDQRHELQELVVDMVGETMASIGESLEKAVTDAQAKIDGADADKAAREAAKTEAESQVEALRAAVEEKKSQTVKDAEAVTNARAALTEAQEAQRLGGAASQAAGDKKARLEAAQNDTYLPLRECAVADTAEGRRQLKVLTSVGKEYNFDDSLMRAIPMALNKEPAQRGEFDQTLMKQFADELARRIAEQEAVITSGDSANAEREAAVASAQAKLDESKDSQTAGATAFLAAKEELGAATTAMQAAEKALGDFMGDLKAAMDGLDE